MVFCLADGYRMFCGQPFTQYRVVLLWTFRTFVMSHVVVLGTFRPKATERFQPEWRRLGVQTPLMYSNIAISPFPEQS